MPDLRGFLGRFRPAATPGAAGPRGGVPVDRAAEREAELAPVFTQLADAEAEIARVLRSARQEAERRQATAARRAAALLDTALHGLSAIRDDPVADARVAVAAEDAAAVATAVERAESIRIRAAATTPSLADRAVAPLLAALSIEGRS